MKKAIICVLMIFCLYHYGNAQTKEEFDSWDTIRRYSYFKENSNEALIFKGESYAVYDTKSVSSPDLFRIYVNIENDEISGYTLKFGRTEEFSIDFSPDDFAKFTEALNKALEWDMIAESNSVEKFSKDIPVSIISERVKWKSGPYGSDYVIRNQEKMYFFIFFSWDPGNARENRSRLFVTSNPVKLISFTSPETEKSLQGRLFSMDTIMEILENTAEQKVRDLVAAEQKKRTEDKEKRDREAQLFN